MNKMNEDIISTSLIDFDNLTLKAAVNKIRELAGAPVFSYVVTPNVDHMERLVKRGDDVFESAYTSAELTLCDSRIIGKLLEIRGKPIREVIPGSTLTEYLFDHELTGQDKVLVFGLESEHFQRLQVMYSGLNLIHINPSMGFIRKADEVEELLDQVESIRPDFVFISVGSPQQEVFAQKLCEREKVGGVGLCVGASLLFMVGAEKRAPKIVQRCYLEWAYRLCQNPKRLVKRYFGNLLALPSIIKAL